LTFHWRFTRYHNTWWINQDLTLIADGTGQVILNDTVQVSTLSVTQGSTIVCRNANDELAICAANAAGVSLQQAYDAGNSITTTTARNIAFGLADGLANPTSFTLTNAEQRVPLSSTISMEQQYFS